MSNVTEPSKQSNRKSRRPRSNMSGQGFGAIPSFDASDQSWSRLEKAIGCVLENAVRERVKEIVASFLWWSTSDKSTPFADDVQNRLRTVLGASRQLRRELVGDGSNASAEANLRIMGAFRDLRIIEPKEVSVVSGMLRDLEHACSQAIADSEANAGISDEFGRWDSMITNVIKLFSEHGLPVGVSSGIKNSKFVDFVHELHCILPEEVTKRGTQSFDALAKAINRARKAQLDRRLAAKRPRCPNRTLSDENQG